MSPIREKLNSSLHKLGDKLKLKRVRSSEVIEANAEIKVKQPRTLTNSTIFSNHLANPTLLQKHRSQPNRAESLLESSCSDPPSTNSSLEIFASEARRVGTANNPIDLTKSSTLSSPVDPTFTSPASMPATPATAMGDSPGVAHSDHYRANQFWEDSKLARALQDEIDRENERERSRLYRTQIIVPDSDFREYFASLSQKKCPKCRTPVRLNGEQTIARTKTMLRDEKLLHSYLQCKKCKVWLCMGCHTFHDSPLPKSAQVVSGKDFKVAWCCDNSRLFLVGAVACGPEFHKLPPRQREGESSSVGSALRYRLRNRNKNANKSDDRTPKEQEPAATQEEQAQTELSKGAAPAAGSAAAKAPKILSSKLPKGTGYGGHDSEPMAWSKKRGTVENKPPQLSNRKKEQDKQTQAYLSLYFSAMKIVLPSWTAGQGSPFNFSPQVGPIITTMLLRSPLLPKASEIIRNDAVDEILEQDALYNSILDFIEGMAAHHCTFPLLVKEVSLYRQEDQLVHIAFDSSRLAENMPTPFEKSQPLLHILDNLAEQCRHFALSSSAHLRAYEEEQENAILALAHRITQTYEAVDANRQGMEGESASGEYKLCGSDANEPKASRSGSSLAGISAEDAAKALAEWHRKHRVDEIPDEELLQTHTYSKMAKAMVSASGALGRMKKLLTQVASLRTSLPEGIYVRHCSSRLDVMKVLITGPEGTPYENGLFEFDLFCPVNFPSSPPLMQFRTTGGGSVRFNPNLYECGKVCLSLLGTWSGQRWTEQSTILQVLVSIQAMIFTDNPWYNEPGRERVTDQVASDRYNSQVQGWTLQHALLYWLNERLAKPTSNATLRKPPARAAKMNGDPTRTSKAGPIAPSTAKLDPYSPSFDLMDDMPTGVKSKNSSPPKSSELGEARWWNAAKPLGGGEPSPPSSGVGSSDVNPVAKKATKVGGGAFSQDAGALKEPGGYLDQGPNGGIPLLGAISAAASLIDLPSPMSLFASNAATPKTAPKSSVQMLTDLNTMGPEALLFPSEAAKVPGMMEMQIEQFHYELFDSLDMGPTPDTNTRVDSEDDHVWGEVIRKHFGAKANKILATAREWRTTGKGKLPEDPMLRELEEALSRHGFVPSRSRAAGG